VGVVENVRIVLIELDVALLVVAELSMVSLTPITIYGTHYRSFPNPYHP
jgi:hypothetical protein